MVLPLLAVGAGAALGGALPGLLGIGKTKPIEAPKMDQGAFKYGGISQNDMRASGERAQNRTGVGVDYGQTNADRGLAMGSRGMTSDAAEMYRQAALGQGPSAAQAQLRAGIDANMAAAMAQGASARGTGVQRGAAQLASIGAASGANQQAAAQAAMLRAQEQQAGMAGFAQAAQAQRIADLQQMGMSAQQAQYQAQLEDAQRARNDQMQMGYEGLGQQSALANYQGGMAYQTGQAQLQAQANAINSGVAQQNAQRDMQYFQGAVGGAMGGAQMAGMMGGGGAARAAPPPDARSGRYGDPGY